MGLLISQHASHLEIIGNLTMVLISYCRGRLCDSMIVTSGAHVIIYRNIRETWQVYVAVTFSALYRSTWTMATS